MEKQTVETCWQCAECDLHLYCDCRTIECNHHRRSCSLFVPKRKGQENELPACANCGQRFEPMATARDSAVCIDCAIIAGQMNSSDEEI